MCKPENEMKSIKKLVFLTLLTPLFLGMYSCGENQKKNWFKAGGNPESYQIGIDKSIAKNGQKSAFLMSNNALTDQFGTLMQSCEANEYVGKKIKMTGFVKSENVLNWSGMWLRIDGNHEPSAEYFDNMVNRPIEGNTDWTECEIIMDVPENSYSMNFGILLAGTGKVWLDNVQFQIISDSSERFSDSLNIEKSFVLNSKPENLNFEK